MTIFICVSLLFRQGVSQNLIPNGDFENYTSLPTYVGQWGKCIGWSNANGGVWPYGSPDYMHTSGINGAQLPNCHAATVDPYSGNAIMGFVSVHGIVPNWREYLSVQLTDSMIVGETYSISFWITNGRPYHSCGYSSDRIGIHFSTSPLSQVNYELISVVPQVEIAGEVWDTLWQAVSMTYIADAEYNYFTIGNFYDDANTSMTYQVPSGSSAYYFIDKMAIIHIVPPLVVLGPTSICIGDTISLVGVNDTSYAWANGLNPTVIISTDSMLTVSPTSNTTYLLYGTYDTVSVSVNVNLPPTLNIGSDTSICPGDSFLLNALTSNASYSWQDGSISSTLLVTQADTYWVEVTVNNCLVVDSVVVSYILLPSLALGNDTLLCLGDSFMLDATISGATYLWQDSSSTPFFIVTQEGLYWVEIATVGCTITDTITVIQNGTPIIDLGSEIVICDSNSVTLDATYQNASYLWQDNSILPTFIVTESGTYSVEATNSCGTTSVSIEVEMIVCVCLLCIPDAFTPNGEGMDANDRLYIFNKLKDNGETLEDIDFKVFNRWGEMVFEALNPSQIVYPEGGWDGTHRRSGKKLEVGVYVWILNARTMEGRQLGPVSGNVSLIR